MLAEAAARDGVELARLGLGVLQRAGARRAVRRRHHGAAALLRAGPGAGRRRLPRRRAALRLPLHPASGSASATTPTSGSGRSATPTAPPVGLYLGDFFAREGKRGGAWMSSFVRQSDCSAPGRWSSTTSTSSRAPAAGQPTLLTLDEVNTLFHEFGHALHGLSSAVTYPRFSGTSVPRDFVEFPSQVNEMWALWPQVLGNYARHVETGEPLPSAVVEAIDAAQLWGEGFGDAGVPGRHAARPGVAPASPRTPRSTTRSRSSSRRWRTPASPPTWCRRGTGRRTSSTSSPGGYAAGYYSYIWSEVLDADTVEWFKENGGLRRENGDAFRSRLLVRRRFGRPAGRVPRRPRPRRRPGPAAPPPRPGPRRDAPEPHRRRSRGVVPRFRGPAEPREARATPLERCARAIRVAVTARGAAAPGRGRRGRSPSRTSRLGWRWPHTRAAVHDLPALARLLHQPDRLHRAPGSRSPGRRAARRRAATTGSTGSGCGSARRCWPARAPRSARRRSSVFSARRERLTRAVRGRTARLPTTSTLMSRPLGAW